MKAQKRFVITLIAVFSFIMFGIGNIPKTEAAELAIEPAVSVVKFDTVYRYNIYEYQGGVFNKHFTDTVKKLKEEGRLIKVLTFITNVKGKTTLEHKIYYDQNVVKEKPFHKIFFISSSPDDGEKYFLNLCFENEYVNLLHFGFTPNGLRLFVFETNI